jgi:hypothetical protein
MSKQKPLPKIVPDEIGMKTFATIIQEMLPEGLGFTLIVFPFGEDKTLTNYISNAQRADMIACLRETADRIEKNRTVNTPNQN